MGSGQHGAVVAIMATLATPRGALENAGVTDRADAVEALEQAREAYARRSWLEAHEAFSRADDETSLEAEDLGLQSVAALMLCRDDDAVVALERAHHRYLERGETLQAVRAAAWTGLNLASRGAVGPATGWLGRAQRLLDRVPGESVEQGYLLVPLVFQHEAEGDFEAAAAVAAQAAAIGERFDDPDLFSMALHAQGHMLVMAGRVPEGLALLDEAMVAVTTGDLLPFVVGIVYCGMILACQEAFEVGRARQWTLALTEWVEGQPDLVAFTGRCLVHRAEILQLGGSWSDALEEARRACRRFVETENRAAGVAHYREGELLRLRGDFDAADEAYREASHFGWEPQPGLAQLRLAQGRNEAALAAIRRATAAIGEPLKRAALLPAYVEIALACDENDEARTACRELEELAGRYESPMLAAMVAYARGSVALADGNAQAGLVDLRGAQQTWLELDAPYEVARTRALAAHACRELGDVEAETLELDAACAIFRRLGATPDLARLEPSSAPEMHGLSSRELDVLLLVATGRSNREIASTLVISEHTVARHLQNIYRKLGLSSRAAATAFAFEHQLV
jgi:DNA-binding CsgD family transcriptional regulator